MLDYLRPGDAFVDVGANVGVYSLLASIIPSVRVWAFEPSSDTCQRARANVAINALEDRIEVVQAAVGAEEGAVMMTVGLGTVNRVVAPTDPAASESVPMVVLDKHLVGIESSRLAMIKIDVEGDEIAVLEGAKRLIGGSRPAIIVEANDVNGLATWLSNLDYRPFQYFPERRQLAETTWEAPPTGNIIAFADMDLAQQRLRNVTGTHQRST